MAEQLAILELRPLLISALSRKEICEAHFRGKDLSSNTPTAISEIRAGTQPTAPVLAGVGEAPSALAQTLKIDSMALHSSTPVVGAPGQHDATFSVGFRGPPAAIKGHAPIELRARVITEPNSSTISTCTIGLLESGSSNTVSMMSLSFRVAITFVDNSGSDEKCRGVMLKGTSVTDGRVLPDASGGSYYIDGGSNMQRTECVSGLHAAVRNDALDLSNNNDFYDALRSLNPGFRPVMVMDQGRVDTTGSAFGMPWADFIWKAMVLYQPE